ncbi:MAG: glycosyltransferase family 4 protein [Planctomycetaceae bacterium]|nr:glycosyltransferase family 4 protein [Planctomycetaceae bacterium]
MTDRTLKIAIMSSGLGHVARGIETWADVTATAMHERGVDVTLFKGAGDAARPFERVVPCAVRHGRWAPRVAEWSPDFAWRFGCGSAYDFEQMTFALRVLPQLCRERFDVIHLQDPWLALVLERTRSLHKARVILGHGTEEPDWFLQKLAHVQELSPFYLERHGDLKGRQWFAVPNFVDADKFRPGEQRAARELFGLPQDKLIVLCVSALNRSRKRIHWLAYEFLRAELDDAILVVAGAEEPETAALLGEIEPLLADQLVVLRNVPHAQMPLVYRTGDVYAIGSLREVMSISILEAMSTGLPCIGHTWGSTAWAIGDGGTIVDMESPGALAAALELYQEPALREAHGHLARRRVEELFSVDAVMSQFLSMYRTVLGWERTEPDGTRRRFDPAAAAAR